MEFFMKGLFSTKMVRNFPFPAMKVIEVKDTDTVDAAFRTLVENKILSAPVWDEKNNKYLGFFDITDALALIYSVDLLISAIPDSMLKTQTALRLASSGSACGDTSDLLVGGIFEDAQHGSERDAAWCPVNEDTPMSQVIFYLATKTRRVPVIDKATGKVIKIISQSLVALVLDEALNELEKNGKPIPDMFNLTPETTGGFGLREVACVNSETQTAREAFRAIIEKGVSAVGVVDEEGKLFASISTKGVKLFKSMEEAALQRLQAEVSMRGDQPPQKSKKLTLMDMNCGDFVSQVELTASNKGMTMVPAVLVHENTPIRKMISRLAKTRKHRCFVVNENRIPIGVISVSDIAKLLVTDPNAK
mmetsp:Transcript_10040/g.16434  ORF Transcript_10040/g.16434 Transcript_10040/m.16434 type:complete len:362 (-) Transcript_10040:926-2011(-)